MITELHDGTFFAEIEFTPQRGHLPHLVLPSDAIALAVRYGEPVPIFADEEVLEEAGVLFEQDDDGEANRSEIEQFPSSSTRSGPRTSPAATERLERLRRRPGRVSQASTSSVTTTLYFRVTPGEHWRFLMATRPQERV